MARTAQPLGPTKRTAARVANLPKGKRKGKPQKFTPAKKQAILDGVKAADKAGTQRKAVYVRLAETWTADHRTPFEYTAHQVASQFHVSKKRLGYDVVSPDAHMPAKARSKARSKARTKRLKAQSKSVQVPTASGFQNNLDSIQQAMVNMQLQIEDERTKTAAAEKRAVAAEQRLAEISNLTAA